MLSNYRWLRCVYRTPQGVRVPVVRAVGDHIWVRHPRWLALPLHRIPNKNFLPNLKLLKRICFRRPLLLRKRHRRALGGELLQLASRIYTRARGPRTRSY